MPRVRIIHWKAEEAAALIEACRGCGFEVEFDDVRPAVLIRLVRTHAPDALVIDLSRMPSRGREAALVFRRSKYARHVPIVFVDGEPEKVEAIRRLLPDAFHARLKQVCARVRAACAKPVETPVVPPEHLHSYTLRTVAQKLGIREGSRVAVFDPPRDYAAVLGALPDGVEFLEEPEDVHPVTLWFVRDPRVYQAGMRRMRAIAHRTKLWVIWRKGGADGLTQYVIREGAIEVGLIDYKICAVGSQWSGMALARKKS